MASRGAEKRLSASEGIDGTPEKRRSTMPQMIGFSSFAAAGATRDQLDAAYLEAEAAGDKATSFSIGCLLFWMDIHPKIPLEDTTQFGPKRFTHGPVPYQAKATDTALLYSVSVTGIQPDMGFQWPLEVYGFVAVRDNFDFKRNMVFCRDRNNCQTLTAEDSSLILTGPSRSVISIDPIYFEVELKVKGTRESEDKILSFLAIEHDYMDPISFSGKLFRKEYTNKYCTTELLFACLRDTVEATVDDVKVVEGLWNGFCLRFTARTKLFPDADFVLFDSRGGGIVVSDNGTIELSRSVVSVESNGELELTVEAREPGKSSVVASDVITLTPQRNGTTNVCFNLGFCKMEALISWSLLLPFMI